MMRFAGVGNHPCSVTVPLCMNPLAAKLQSFLVLVDTLFIIRSRAFQFYTNQILIQTVQYAVPTGLFDLLYYAKVS